MQININLDRSFAKRFMAVVACAALIGFGGVACGSSSKGAQQSGQSQSEQAFKQQSQAEPYPADKLTDSLERKNLAERLLRYNNPSKISYIYLLAPNGSTVVSYFTIKGKVTSNDSQMTTSALVDKYCYSGDCSFETVPAPEDDGSYGGNEPGIFFFTTDNVMVTWSGPYLMTDAPMKMNGQEIPLQYAKGSKPSSTAGHTK